MPENLPDTPKECRVRTLYSRCKIGVTCAGFLALIPLFQNFSAVTESFLSGIPLANLKPKMKEHHGVLVAAANNGTADIRDLAPRRPASMDEPTRTIAVPQSGNDLSSIGQDWATRQANLITGGAEQRFLDDLNKKVLRLVRFEEVEGEPWPETGEPSGSADGKGDSSGDTSGDRQTGARSHGRRPASIETQTESSPKLMPTAMRFTALNRVEVGLTNKTWVSCSFTGNSMLLNVKSPIADQMDVNLRHDTNGAKSTVNLNYNW